jgi:hypothetical protein
LYFSFSFSIFTLFEKIVFSVFHQIILSFNQFVSIYLIIAIAMLFGSQQLVSEPPIASGCEVGDFRGTGGIVGTAEHQSW